jgi:hypothetical protein
MKLAGVPGFEPGHGGIKIHCLTAWLHPKKQNRPLERFQWFMTRFGKRFNHEHMENV